MMNPISEETALMTTLSNSMPVLSCASVPNDARTKAETKLSGVRITSETVNRIMPNSNAIPRVRQKCPRVRCQERRSAANTPIFSMTIAGTTKHHRTMKNTPMIAGIAIATITAKMTAITALGLFESAFENIPAMTPRSSTKIKVRTTIPAATSKNNRIMRPH